MTTETRHKCSYCGRRNRSVSMHSGVYECDRCWDWRKLDGPAARHWAKVTEEFLSNVDMYDYIRFMPKVFGDKDTGAKMLAAAWDLLHITRGMIIMHDEGLDEQGPRP